MPLVDCGIDAARLEVDVAEMQRHGVRGDLDPVDLLEMVRDLGAHAEITQPHRAVAAPTGHRLDPIAGRHGEFAEPASDRQHDLGALVAEHPERRRRRHRRGLRGDLLLRVAEVGQQHDVGRCLELEMSGRVENRLVDEPLIAGRLGVGERNSDAHPASIGTERSCVQHPWRPPATAAERHRRSVARPWSRTVAGSVPAWPRPDPRTPSSMARSEG